MRQKLEYAGNVRLRWNRNKNRVRSSVAFLSVVMISDCKFS